MKIIGLDVGEKRIGVAKVDSNTRIAIPVGFIETDGSEWQEIARMARINNTNLFVLGLPRSNEGNETKQTLYVRNFAKTLTEKIPDAKIRFQDESLTSVEAENRLKARKKKYTRGDIDAEAATIILQDFIEGFKGSASDNTAPAESTNLVKKEAEKAKIATKKAGHKIKKWMIISPSVLLIILLGVTAVLKIRDYARWQREQEMIEWEQSQVAKTFDFTIRPGETIFDIKKHLLAVDRNGGAETPEGEEPLPNYTTAEIDEAFSATYDFEFLQGRPEGASLEGYLYPETHNFYGEATVKEILTKFLEGMEAAINENSLAEKYSEKDLSLYEGITLASVIQKESPGPEMATVAQVFLTRLDYGWKLGSDVTVSYAVDLIDPEREVYADNAAALTIDSCYNTRLYTGLPCGPISNPGLTALLAVAEPTDTEYLYFLTGDDGLMYYSYTESEHNSNAALHCQELCSISL